MKGFRTGIPRLRGGSELGFSGARSISNAQNRASYRRLYTLFFALHDILEQGHLKVRAFNLEY